MTAAEELPGSAAGRLTVLLFPWEEQPASDTVSASSRAKIICFIFGYVIRKELLAQKKADLEAEQTDLHIELACLKGLFTGKRKKEIAARLAEIEQVLKEYT